MKRVIMCLFLCMFLIGLVGAVNENSRGQNNNKTCGDGICTSEENATLCVEPGLYPNGTMMGGGGCNQVCPKDCSPEKEDNETEIDTEGLGNKTNQGLGQIIRNRVRAGVYTSPEGYEIRVSELAQNRTRLSVGNISADTELEIEEAREIEEGSSIFKANLSNGRKTLIKIMPNTASERALERLGLKVCNETNNCTIELKEVGKGNQTRAAYEIQVQKHKKLLGLFKIRAQEKAQIDSETGEVIVVKKPWWAFLATSSD